MLKNEQGKKISAEHLGKFILTKDEEQEFYQLARREENETIRKSHRGNQKRLIQEVVRSSFAGGFNAAVALMNQRNKQIASQILREEAEKIE